MSPRAAQPSLWQLLTHGAVVTVLSVAGNYAVTTYRVGALEQSNRELAARVSAAEGSIVAIKLEEAQRLTRVEDELGTVKETLARIDGRLSGVAPAKGRVP